MLTHNTLGKNGRLGNQMFQYAATKGIALNGGHDYQIPSGGHSLFECFELPGIENHINPMQGLQTFNERFFYFDEDFFNEQVDDRDLFGYFQTEKYFKHIEKDIRKDFNFKPEIIEAANKYSDIFNNDKVFSIHFRRTDYLNFPNAHPTPSENYYKSAIDIFSDYDFGLVFSDDIEWCKSLPFLQSNRFIFSDNHHFIDLYLMTQCRSNIIANSSFSWWGAWLNPNEDKTIFAPSVWFGPEVTADTKDLIPEDWLILK